MRSILSGPELRRTIARLAAEILEAAGGTDDLCLVGIHTGGAHLAHRISKVIGEIEGACPVVGEMDITLYRDDLYTGLEKPVLGSTRIPFAMDGSCVVIIDDVLFTGRTVRAALDLLMDYGRPSWIKLAVAVDRGHRELPIAADFVGKRMDSAKTDLVRVQLTEDGSDTDGVFVIDA